MMGETGNTMKFVEKGTVFDEGLSEKGRKGGSGADRDAGELKAVVAKAATGGKEMGERKSAVGMGRREIGLEHERFITGELTLEVDRENVGVKGDGKRQRRLGSGETSGSSGSVGGGKDEIFERTGCGG